VDSEFVPVASAVIEGHIAMAVSSVANALSGKWKESKTIARKPLLEQHTNMPKLIKETRTVGDTQYVFYGALQDAEQIAKKIKDLAIPDGHAVKNPDGSEVFIRDEVLIDTTQQGSNQFTFDKTGNKVKHARTFYHKSAEGIVTKKFLRFVYKSL